MSVLDERLREELDVSARASQGALFSELVLKQRAERARDERLREELVKQ